MIVLGEGRLSWNREERVSDRYGAVILMHDGDSWTEPSGYTVLDPALNGRRGTLIAEVLETRQSTHIGDWFHGFAPSTPEVGEQIRLGSGTVFVEFRYDAWMIGLRPDDGRDVFWLAPNQLYRAHEQTVRLMLLDPEEEPDLCPRCSGDHDRIDRREPCPE